MVTLREVLKQAETEGVLGARLEHHVCAPPWLIVDQTDQLIALIVEPPTSVVRPNDHVNMAQSRTTLFPRP